MLTSNSIISPLSEIPQQWQELNALWEKDKLPQKHFCKLHGVDYKQFISWRGKIVNASSKKLQPKQFAQLSVSEPKQSVSPRLTTGAIKICFPDGTSVHIPSELDGNKLLLLLSSLRGQS